MKTWTEWKNKSRDTLPSTDCRAKVYCMHCAVQCSACIIACTRDSIWSVRRQSIVFVRQDQSQKIVHFLEMESKRLVHFLLHILVHCCLCNVQGHFVLSFETILFCKTKWNTNWNYINNNNRNKYSGINKRKQIKIHCFGFCCFVLFHIDEFIEDEYMNAFFFLGIESRWVNSIQNNLTENKIATKMQFL